MSASTLCECGHPRSEHLGGTGQGACVRDRNSSTRPSCNCKAYGVARICPGCGGDGIDFAVTDRRRQMAARDVDLFSESTHNGATSRCVSQIAGVSPVANPFIEAIRRLESRVSKGARLDHDIHAYVAHDVEKDGYIEDRETPTSLPDLVHAAYGLWPEEMCKSCYGNGRALLHHYPKLDHQARELEALLVRSKDLTGSIEGGAKC